MNLRVLEKEDLPLLTEWMNNTKLWGEYFSPDQFSKAEMEKRFSEPSKFEAKWFMIEKKDGTKIGYMLHFYAFYGMAKTMEIAYGLIPSERRKGYCSEAVRLMVDYLFLSKHVSCVQAITHINNVASQGVLKKVSFEKEGSMRKRAYIRGEWIDMVLFSILRDEWKEPKILTRTT